jgi:hypothetical protein
MRSNFLILIVFLAVYLSGFSTPKLYTKTIVNNSDTVVINSENNTIYFFCPTRFLSKENYLEKAEYLIKGEKINNIVPLNIKMFFFNEDIEYYSGGLQLKIQTNKDTSFVCNEFAAYFFGFQNFEYCLNRLEISKYYQSFKFLDYNCYNVYAKPGVTCFKTLDERIPFYKRLIKEYFYPVYTQDEKIGQLKDSVIVLNSKILSLENRISLLESRIDSNPNIIKVSDSNSSSKDDPKKCFLQKIIMVRKDEK